MPRKSRTVPDFPEQRRRPCVVATGIGRMQTSFDSLLVALFVALSPAENDGQASLFTESFRQGFQQGYEGLRLRAEAHGQRETADCRYFADAAARGKCIVRTNRAHSGAA